MMKRFGEKLRLLRTRRGITLKELAHSLGLTAHGYISEIESGKKKPTADFVLKVARYFKVTTDELLKDELEVGGK
jgi:transcriptional regulator with XRE-family HTH domain